MKRIFIVGTQRSGSNLLRMMLNSHSELLAPHPPNVLKHFVPLEHIYEQNPQLGQQALFEDILQLVKYNPIDWENISFDVEDIIGKHKVNNVFEYFLYLMDAYAKQEDCNGWVCKSTHNFIYMEELLKADKGVFFIHLYRDPRDVTLSFMKADVGNKHPYSIAKEWSDTQDHCIQTLQSIHPDNFFTIQYEQLIEEPQVIMAELCNKVGLTFEPQMMEFYKSKSAKDCSKAGKRWENLKNPVMSNNYKKYKKGLSTKQIKMIEYVAQAAMKHLGYELDNYLNGYRIDQREIETYQNENRFLIKEKNRKGGKQKEFLAQLKSNLELKAKILQEKLA